MSIQTKPFDEESDFDQIADRMRRDIAEYMLRWQDQPVYRALDPCGQVAVVMAGLATGMVGTLFSMVKDTDRNTMMKLIEEYLPQAREQAEAILE